MTKVRYRMRAIKRDTVEVKNKLLTAEAAKAGRSQYLKVGQTECDVFYKSGKLKAQIRKRDENVRLAMQLFPQIRKIQVLAWENDWRLVKKFLAELGVPVNIHDLNQDNWSGAAQGKISHWATLLLAFAYQVEFKRPCMILLEDDLLLPVDFAGRLEKLALPQSSHEVLWLQSSGPGNNWGEGFVFGLGAAQHFLTMVCLQGIHMANDRFIMDHFLVHKVDVHTFRLVKAGKGNIKGSPQADRGEFNYPKKTTQTCYSKLLTAYVPEESKPAWTELDLESVAFRIANPNFKYLVNTTANSWAHEKSRTAIQDSLKNGTLFKNEMFNSSSSMSAMAKEKKAKSSFLASRRTAMAHV